MSVVVRRVQLQDGNPCRDEGSSSSDCIAVNDETSDDVPLSSAVEGTINFGVKGQAVKVASDWVYSGHAADKDVVNRLCFHKRRLGRSHDFLPLGLVDFVAQSRVEHGLKRRTSGRSRLCHILSQNLDWHAYESLKTRKLLNRLMISLTLPSSPLTHISHNAGAA